MLTGIIVFVIVGRGKPAYPRAVGVAGLSMAVSMIHVFCDVVGGGPTWLVYPLWPVSDFGWTVSWSWTLADWPNTVILFLCLAGMMLYAKISGHSPIESINYKFDRWFVTIIQHGSSRPYEEEKNGEVTAAGVGNAVRVRIAIYVLLALLIVAVLAPLGFQTEQLNLWFF